MPSVSARPLSPHLSIWRWRANMTVSILHRATGHALAFGGVALLLWGLVSLATGPEAYGVFYACASGVLGKIIAAGLTWLVFQHMLSGIRHLIMDTGAGYEPALARRTATLTFVGSVLLTALVWALILL